MKEKKAMVPVTDFSRQRVRRKHPKGAPVFSRARGAPGRDKETCEPARKTRSARGCSETNTRPGAQMI